MHLVYVNVTSLLKKNYSNKITYLMTASTYCDYFIFCCSGHPECPGRISAILNMYNEFQLTHRLLILPV